MKILGAVLLALVVSMGCGGSKGSGAQTPEPPAGGGETPAPAEPDAAPEAMATPPAAAPDAAPAAAPAPVATTSGYDLKVLPATWSKDQVKDYMKKVVSAGLGVKCDHCHDVQNFAADSEHKTIARGMIKMADDLNKQYFKGEPRLGCITCHNGKPEPKHE